MRGYDAWKTRTPADDELRPHADGSDCYVLGSTEVQPGRVPVCDEPGCGRTIDDFWLADVLPEYDKNDDAEHAASK